jgi:translation initiation factor 5B
MAPKKKGGKKQAEDWEADLGETIDPVAQATEEARNGDANTADGDAEDTPAGGLLAALRKNKTKRAKKGKIDNDFVEGEDPTQTDSPAPEVDLSGKAPEEATFDDEELIIGAGKQGKAGKKQPDKDGDDEEDGGGLKSKKEKEKEKKEREKQRKKEQVCFSSTSIPFRTDSLLHRLQKGKPLRLTLHRRQPSQRKPPS